MSFYTIFDQKEPTVTSTTTSILQAADPVLISSSQQKHASQTTVGALSALASVTAVTTLTTGTPISSYGLTTLQTTSGTANNVSWTIADPMVAGLCKTLYCISTSTTTPVTLQVLFTNATGISSDTASSTSEITSVGFSGFGGFAELQAISTSVWAVVGRSPALMHSS